MFYYHDAKILQKCYIAKFLYNFFVVYLFFSCLLIKRGEKQPPPPTTSPPSRHPQQPRQHIRSNNTESHRPPHPRPLQGERWAHPLPVWYASRPELCALGAQPGALALPGWGEGITPVKSGLHQGIGPLFSAAALSLVNRSCKESLLDAIALIINYLGVHFGMAFTGWLFS